MKPDQKFDEHIKSLFQDHNVPFDQEHWDLFESQLDTFGLDGTYTIGPDLVDQLKNFEAEPIPGDWDVMSDLLDQAKINENQHFDKNIKDSVDQYEAPYDAQTWPVLEQKITAAEIRRRRVIITKILEIASVLLFLFTLYNFYPELKLRVFDPQKDFESSHDLFTDSQNITNQTSLENTTVAIAITGTDLNTGSNPATKLNERRTDLVENGSTQSSAANLNVTFEQQSQLPPTINNNLIPAENARPEIYSQLESSNKESTILIENQIEQSTINENAEGVIAETGSSSELDLIASHEKNKGVSIPSLLGNLHVRIFNNEVHHKLYGLFEPIIHNRIQTRVGIHAGADVNILHFPADNFFSGGNQISFEAQDLPALGYGGGISLGWYGYRFGFESGIHYSNKSFKPGRQLLIGETLENSKVDFQAVQIDLVTIPMSVSYRVKPIGNIRFYVVGGIDFNLIAQAHYDLKIENNYPLPLSITQSASALASNREAHRVKEHFLDGATFYSKTFVTAHAGFGLEKFLNPDLSVFIQPTYLHQVEIDGFSNNNGKHFQTLNLRIGTRMPLK